MDLIKAIKAIEDGSFIKLNIFELMDIKDILSQHPKDANAKKALKTLKSFHKGSLNNANEHLSSFMTENAQVLNTFIDYNPMDDKEDNKTQLTNQCFDNVVLAENKSPEKKEEFKTYMTDLSKEQTNETLIKYPKFHNTPKDMQKEMYKETFFSNMQKNFNDILEKELKEAQEGLTLEALANIEKPIEVKIKTVNDVIEKNSNKVTNFFNMVAKELKIDFSEIINDRGIEELNFMTKDEINKNQEALEKLSDFRPLEDDVNSQNEEVKETKRALESIIIDNTNKEVDFISENDFQDTAKKLADIATRDELLTEKGFANKEETEQKQTFTKSFVNNLQTYLTTTITNEVATKKLNKDEAKEEVAKIFDDLKNKKPRTIKNTNVIATTKVFFDAIKQSTQNTAKKAQNFKILKKVTDFDKNMSKKHPKAWGFAKSFGTSYAISAAFGPVGVCALTAYHLKKSYDKLNKEAKKNNTSLWSEIKKDPWGNISQITGAALAASSVVATGYDIGLFGDAIKGDVAKLSDIKMNFAHLTSGNFWATKGLASGASLVKAGQEINKAINAKTPEERKASMSKAKVLFTSTLAGITLGSITGGINSGAEFVSETTAEPKAEVVEAETKAVETETKVDNQKAFTPINVDEQQINTPVKTPEVATIETTETAPVVENTQQTTTQMENSSKDVITNQWMASDEGQAKLAVMEANIAAYNQEHGTNISVHDMARDGFVTHYVATDLTTNAETVISNPDASECNTQNTTEEKYRNLVTKAHLMKTIDGYSSEHYSAYQEFLQTGEVSPKAVEAYTMVQAHVSEQGHWNQDLTFNNQGQADNNGTNRINAPCLDGNAEVNENNVAVANKDGSFFTSYIEGTQQGTTFVNTNPNEQPLTPLGFDTVEEVVTPTTLQTTDDGNNGPTEIILEGGHADGPRDFINQMENQGLVFKDEPKMTQEELEAVLNGVHYPHTETSQNTLNGHADGPKDFINQMENQGLVFKEEAKMTNEELNSVINGSHSPQLEASNNLSGHTTSQADFANQVTQQTGAQFKEEPKMTTEELNEVIDNGHTQKSKLPFNNFFGLFNGSRSR